MGPLICVWLNSTNRIVFAVDLGGGRGVDAKKLLIICWEVHFEVADNFVSVNKSKNLFICPGY